MVTIARLARGEPDVVVACHCDTSNREISEKFQPHRTHCDRAARYHLADLIARHTAASFAN
jgi:cytosine/adenosine deaminase-related metal-dependent hydrolase